MNHFTKQSILLILLVILSSNSFGQKCLTAVKRAQALENNPHLAEKLQKQEESTQRWITENKSRANLRSVETLPVVVHVIWKDAQENISVEQIMSQMEVLNQDFRKLNANFSNGPMAFQALGADAEIEFCLASVDPSGNPTDGITRTQTTVDGIGGTESWYSTANGGKDAWDINKYINIWVCNLGDDGLLGFATPPGTADPAEADGMVIAPHFFGTTGTAANSQPNHLGRTATHEMGHYLNLEHLWGVDYGGCDEDDFVEDTPVQNAESSGCPTFPLYDNCTGSGDGLMFNNYLDYADDDCMTMFTEGQKMRMLAAINGPRASLLSSNGCSGMTSTEEITSVQPSIFPNPATDKIFISFPQGYAQSEICTIYSLNGLKMLTFKSEEKKEIHLENFPAGTYYLISSDPSVKMQKFVVSK